MANLLTTRRLPGLPVLVLGALLASCQDEIREDDPPAQYIAVRRAWQPGERAAKIQTIVTTRSYVFPYAGDISDLAPQFYADPDSVTVMIANPALQPSITGPAGGPASLTLFSPTWDFVALKLTIVNNDPVPPDTIFWHLALWADPADAGSHGFAIAFSRANTFNIKPINTTTFDASGGTAGAAGGEIHASTGTYWEDDAKGGRYRVNAQTYPGAFATVTSGPFTGGLMRAGQAFGRVQAATFDRQVGTENPASFAVDFDYRTTGLPATEILCVFPSPCTTNVPLMAAASGAGGRGAFVRAEAPYRARAARFLRGGIQ